MIFSEGSRNSSVNSIDCRHVYTFVLVDEVHVVDVEVGVGVDGDADVPDVCVYLAGFMSEEKSILNIIKMWWRCES